MKNLALLFSVFYLLIQIACVGEVSEDKSQKTPNSDMNKEVQLNDEKSKMSTYLDRLQGTWKRDSYPYGTIHFKNKQVKFATGEGLAEPPKFMGFEIAMTCPNKNEVASDAYDFVIITSSDSCEPIRLNGEQFTIYYGSTGVDYTKQSDSASPSAEN